MTDQDATVMYIDREIHWDVETHLAAHLPGLTDDELVALAERVAEEMQVRIGNVLSEGLNDAKLEDFQALIEAGDDRRCAQWLAEHRPGYRAIVASVKADLIAETVRVVGAANPGAVHGDRIFAQMLRTSTDLAVAHFSSYGVECTHDGDGLQVIFAGDDDASDIVVWASVSGRHADTFTVTGAALGLDFPHAEQDRLVAFAAEWNRRTWNPKAVVVADESDGSCRVEGEVATRIGTRVSRSQVDAVLGSAVGSMFALFGALRAAAPEAGGLVEEA